MFSMVERHWYIHNTIKIVFISVRASCSCLVFACILCPLVWPHTTTHTHTNALYLCLTASAPFLLNQSCFLLSFCPGSSWHCVGRPTFSMCALALVVCTGNGAYTLNSNIVTTAVHYVGTAVTLAQHNITYNQMFFDRIFSLWYVLLTFPLATNWNENTWNEQKLAFCPTLLSF